MSVSNIRKRYVAFEIISGNRFTFQELVSAILVEAEKEGLSNVSILHERYNENTRKGLIKVNHNHILNLRKTLDNIQKINNKEVKIKSIGTSGTIKTANIKYLQNKKKL